MDQQLVIKLTSGDGNGVPVGIVESPPMLYSNFKTLYPTITFSEKATAIETEPYWYGVFEWKSKPNDVVWDKTFESIGLTKNSDGVWRETFQEVNLSQEQIDVKINQKKEQIEKERNAKLRRSDWTQLPDAPEVAKQNVDVWKVYRQELRDFTAKEGYPWMGTFVEELNWPIRPDGKNEKILS